MTWDHKQQEEVEAREFCLFVFLKSIAGFVCALTGLSKTGLVIRKGKAQSLRGQRGGIQIKEFSLGKRGGTFKKATCGIATSPLPLIYVHYINCLI